MLYLTHSQPNLPYHRYLLLPAHSALLPCQLCPPPHRSDLISCLLCPLAQPRSHRCQCCKLPTLHSQLNLPYHRCKLCLFIPTISALLHTALQRPPHPQTPSKPPHPLQKTPSGTTARLSGPSLLLHLRPHNRRRSCLENSRSSPRKSSHLLQKKSLVGSSLSSTSSLLLLPIQRDIWMMSSSQDCLVILKLALPAAAKKPTGNGFILFCK